MAHAMGNGCLTFIDERSGFKDIFAEDEVAFYNSKDELVEKINYFISNPKERQKVAQKGYTRYHELFNETKMAEYIVSVADETFDSSLYPYATQIK